MNYSDNVINEVKKAIVGKDEVIRDILTAIIAGGHILLEDIPGVGKTTMAVAFAKAMGLSYSRVQFTPDVLPSDIVGYSIYNRDKNTAEYIKGAVFANVFLADEINRATSRTQSALLEAMEEKQVTVDGKTYLLDEPFFVIATQNPVGAVGTQLLPDSQMDRFMVRLSIGYPETEDEREIVLSRMAGKSDTEVQNVLSATEVREIRRQAEKVYISPETVDYAVALVTATRNHKSILRGVSPRGTIALAAMAKATAFIEGRDFVIPEDVEACFVKTVAHRILLTPEAEANGVSVTDILDEIITKTVAPKLK
ncbi:MAG: MoxR family ATPase [Clostridia bacterium]|nr:MoxR family ATPase [Clostridia bacterium]